MQNLPHAEIKRLRALRSKKGRVENGTFLVEGEKGVQEALMTKWPLRNLVVTKQHFATYADAGVPIFLVDEEVISRISGVETPPGVIAEAKIPDGSIQQKQYSGHIIVGYGIADPGNLGTIIRTADWFGIRQIILSENSVDPYNEKVVRSSMGSLFHLSVSTEKDIATTITQVKSQGYAIVATSINGGDLAWPQQPVCLIMGSESHGVPVEISALADSIVSIPGYGKAESLNVGVSCGILLHDLTRGNQ